MWCSFDDDGEDDGVGSFDEESDAFFEGEEFSRRAFDSSFGEEAECGALLEVSDGVAESCVFSFVAVDEDDACVVPERVECGDFHIRGHDPADFEGECGLYEERIDSCGVVGDDDERPFGDAEGVSRGDVFGSLDLEAVHEGGVELNEAVDGGGEGIVVSECGAVEPIGEYAPEGPGGDAQE